MLDKNVANYLQEKGFISTEDLEKIGKEFMANQEYRDTIKEINRHNFQLYEKSQLDLKKFKEILSASRVFENNDSFREKFKSKMTEEIQVDEESNFYNNLLYAGENIEYFLPKPNTIHFYYTMNLFIKEVLKEIMEWQNIITRDISKEELVEYTAEIESKKNLLNRLIEYRDQKIDTEETKEQQFENRLVYLSSASDGCYILNDLKKIEFDYYASFLELLKSIQNGTFKNFKVFVSNNKLRGIYEVKDFKTRIVFSRLKDDIYIIMAMFMKKSDNDLAYRAFLQNRVAVYQANKEKFLMNTFDENYMEENRLITGNIKLALTKSGDSNE